MIVPLGPFTVAGSVIFPTLNRPASVPVSVIEPAANDRAAWPRFSIVNVRVIVAPVVEPKFVWSVGEGDASPSAMFVSLPFTLISGAFTVIVTVQVRVFAGLAPSVAVYVAVIVAPSVMPTEYAPAAGFCASTMFPLAVQLSVGDRSKI